MNLNINNSEHYPINVYQNRQKNFKNFVLGAVWVFILSILIMSMLLPNNKLIEPYSDVGFVVNGRIIDTQTPPVIFNSTPLISFSDIKKYIDEYIFFDKENKKVIITTKDKVIRMKVGSKKGSINNKSLVLNTKIKEKNEEPYIPLQEFEDIYNIEVKYIKKNNVVVVDTNKVQQETGIAKHRNVKVRKEPLEKLEETAKLDRGEQFKIVEKFDKWYKVCTQTGKKGFIQKEDVAIDTLQRKSCISKQKNIPIRRLPSIKQPIYKKTTGKEKLKIYAKADGWYKVRTNDGIIGYIKESHVTKVVAKTQKVDAQKQVSEKKSLDEKLTLVWEQVNYVTPNMNKIDKVEGLDIVSPTWFEVINKNGKIRNKVDKSYIRWARGNGYKIWALVSNGVSPDKTKMTSEFLSNSTARKRVINKLIYLSTQLYDLDGINVDFEYVAVKDKRLLTQFMRELYPLCKEKGLTLSIDVTVKVNSPNSLCFNRKELSKTCDYIIAMTYDQYWSTSPVSGSVAEYSWVDKNVKMLLDEVPKEKLIMGIPFYCRLWKEVPDSKPTSRALTMAQAKNIIRQNGAKMVWNEKSGQYYAEFKKGKVKNRIWLEDTRSIDLKSSLALKYDLAGVACWRRGYETSDIWQVLNKNIKQTESYKEWKKKHKK